MTRVYCSHLEDEPDFPGCCPMCHEDDDIGEVPLQETEIDGKTYVVCCDVLRWVEAKPKEATQ